MKNIQVNETTIWQPTMTREALDYFVVLLQLFSSKRRIAENAVGVDNLTEAAKRLDQARQNAINFVQKLIQEAFDNGKGYGG